MYLRSFLILVVLLTAIFGSCSKISNSPPPPKPELAVVTDVPTVERAINQDQSPQFVPELLEKEKPTQTVPVLLQRKKQVVKKSPEKTTQKVLFPIEIPPAIPCGCEYHNAILSYDDLGLLLGPQAIYKQLNSTYKPQNAKTVIKSEVGWGLKGIAELRINPSFSLRPFVDFANVSYTAPTNYDLTQKYLYTTDWGVEAHFPTNTRFSYGFMLGSLQSTFMTKGLNVLIIDRKSSLQFGGNVSLTFFKNTDMNIGGTLEIKGIYPFSANGLKTNMGMGGNGSLYAQVFLPSKYSMILLWNAEYIQLQTSMERQREMTNKVVLFLAWNFTAN